MKFSKIHFLRQAQIIIASGLLCLPVSANAGYTNGSKVIKVLIMGAGQVIFYLSSPDLSPPTCATRTERWVFDGTTPAGQAKLAFILSAQARQVPIFVNGLHSCGVWGDTETVDYLGDA